MGIIYQEAQEAASYIRGRIGKRKPKMSIVLGSGLGSLADELKNRIVIDYSEIPGFMESTVPGHSGKLVVGEFGGKSIICMSGRFHYYEGYSLQQVTFPIRVFSLLGIKNLILTNAAGGVDTGFSPGDLMLIKDHINLSGLNALIGPNEDMFGPRFLGCSDIYTSNIREQAEQIAEKIGIQTRKGIYYYMPGPSYEAPAEIPAIRNNGGDAVGMSTVHEALVACHCSMRVLGISCITNMAAGILPTPLSHQEVIDTAEQTREKFSKLIKACVKGIKWN